MVVDSCSLERLAQFDSRSVGEVGIAWTQLLARFSFCLVSQAFQLKSTLNPSERLAQLDSASNTLFLLLMVISSSAKIGLKAQNATQISRALPDITYNTFKAKIL
jgi:DMSO/TMAO reductase YedYZ heme-binding membrane subunit